MYYDNSAFILSCMIPKVSTKESLGEALWLEMQLEGCGGQWHGIDIEISFASQGLFEVLLEMVCMGGTDGDLLPLLIWLLWELVENMDFA